MYYLILYTVWILFLFIRHINTNFNNSSVLCQLIKTGRKDLKLGIGLGRWVSTFCVVFFCKHKTTQWRSVGRAPNHLNCLIQKAESGINILSPSSLTDGQTIWSTYRPLLGPNIMHWAAKKVPEMQVVKSPKIWALQSFSSRFGHCGHYDHVDHNSNGGHSARLVVPVVVPVNCTKHNIEL
jgi:hypothetical protein